MSMYLFTALHPHAAGRTRLRLLCGYENGSVTMREYTGGAETSIEGRGWDVLWSVRLHVESGTSDALNGFACHRSLSAGGIVMAMAVSRDGAFALSVSADHLIGQYNLAVSDTKGCTFGHRGLTLRRRLKSRNLCPPRAPCTKRSILGTVPSVSEMTGESAPLAAGMEGM